MKQLIHSQELHAKMISLETKTLRSQMNPHFLFNSLNSIKSYITKNEPRIATNYLNKFAHLMRLILSYSEEMLIPLADEIKGLRLYIELEQFRMTNKFDFDINIDPCLKADAILVPPLIIQPFVDHSIWQSLDRKNGERILLINISYKGGRLIVSIRDNGIGRSVENVLNNVELKDYKSMCVRITSERLDLNENKISDKLQRIIVNELKDSNGSTRGTEVILNLPMKYINDKIKELVV